MTVTRFFVYYRILVLNSVKIQKNSIEFYMILCYDTIQYKVPGSKVPRQVLCMYRT